MRSWRSTPAHAPGRSGASPVTSSVPTMSPRSTRGAEELRGGERFEIGECLLGQSPPHPVGRGEHPGGRIAKGPGVSLSFHVVGKNAQSSVASPTSWA